MDQYKTKDIYEASALLCKKAKLIGLEREANFYWFVFEDKVTCNKVTNAYWNNQLRVFAKDYSDSIRTLKDRLFANNQS